MNTVGQASRLSDNGIIFRMVEDAHPYKLYEIMRISIASSLLMQKALSMITLSNC